MDYLPVIGVERVKATPTSKRADADWAWRERLQSDILPIVARGMKIMWLT
jgi:hypothetical protein